KTLKATRQSLERVDAWGSKLVTSKACAMTRSRFVVVDAPAGEAPANRAASAERVAANPKEARERKSRRSISTRLEQLPDGESRAGRGDYSRCPRMEY